MELPDLSRLGGTPAGLAVAVSSVLVVAYGFNLVARWRYRHFPGPTPRFLVGNLDQLWGKNEWEVLGRWARSFGKIYAFYDGREPVVVVADPALAQEVLVKKFKTFHNRKIPDLIRHVAAKSMPRMMMNMVWAQLASYMGDMNRSTRRLQVLLKKHADSNELAEVRKYTGAFALEVVGTSAFGIDFNTQTEGGVEDEKLVQAATATFKQSKIALLVGKIIQCFPFLARLMGFLLTHIMPKISQAARHSGEMRKYVVVTAYTLLKNAERRIAGTAKEDSTGEVELPWGEYSYDPSANEYKDKVPAEGSLPDLLMQGKHKLTGEPLTDAQMTAQSHVFILAGYDTTANTLAYSLYLLARHPEEQAKVVAEVDAFDGGEELTHSDLERFPYTRAVVDEALRMFPPAPGTHRVAKDNTEIGGHHIPAGTLVVINLWGMHRDPKQFPDPETFCPSRFLKDSEESKARHPYAYLPFGAGPRMCVGYKFALQEIVLALVTSFKSFTFSLDPARDQSTLRTKGFITMAPADGIWLKVHARLSSNGAHGDAETTATY